MRSEFARRQSCESELDARTFESTVEIHSRLAVLGDHARQLNTAIPASMVAPRRTWTDSAWHFCGVRDLLTLREQWVQVATAALLGSSALYCDCVAQVYLQQNVEGTGSDASALVDMGFKLLGKWEAPHAADIALVSFIAITLLRFVIIPGPYAMRWTIIRRWFICMGMLFLLRGMSIIATILPNPDKNCKSTIHPKGSGENDWNIFVLAWCVAVGQCVTCADVLYSGHTVNFTLAALIWYDYARMCPYVQCNAKWIDKLQLPRVFAIVYVICGYLIIIKTHFHYSVDVWIGFWMTYFVWSYYHEAIKASPFHRGLLMRFLTWLEMHATDLKYWRIRVANQFLNSAEMRLLDQPDHECNLVERAMLPAAADARYCPATRRGSENA